MESRPSVPRSQSRADLLSAVQRELARCLRLLTSCVSEKDLFQYLPTLKIVDGHSPLPEQPLRLETSHEITLYTHGDLNRPVEEILTILLHKAVHVANAYRWRVDCNCASFHNQ